MLIFRLHFVLIFLFAVCLVKGVFAGDVPPRRGIGDVPLLVERMRNHLTSRLASERNI